MWLSFARLILLYGKVILMNKPSVFLLGVQKSGTTAIAGMLAEHSEIFVPSVKETYFFIDESLNSRGESWYLSEYYSRNSVEMLGSLRCNSILSVFGGGNEEGGIIF